MKKIKSAGVLILTIIMFASLILTGAMALPNIDGRDPDAHVSLTIYKLEADNEIFYELQSNGIAQTIPQKATAIAGVLFKIEHVTLREGATEPTIHPEDYVPVSEDSFVATGATNADGMVVFSTDDTKSTIETLLPGQGIYKVTEIHGPGSVTFIVSLPMVSPANNMEWLYNVFAYPKNDRNLSLEKTYVGSSSDGNVLKWQISASIPPDIGSSANIGGSSFVITDALDYRLRYITGTIAGSFTDRAGSTQSLTSSDYELSVATGTDGSQNSIQVLTLTFTETGLKVLAGAIEQAGDDTAGISFSFSTRDDMGLNKNLKTIENEAVLAYKNEANFIYGQLTDKAETILYGIKILTINVNDEILPGVKFAVYTDAECKNKLMNQNDSDLWEVTTDSDGEAYIYGLVEGEYYLRETEAPKGYTKFISPIKVDLRAGTVNAETYTVSVTITNTKDFALPITGGSGTTLFTVGGVLLIAAAVILLILAKKRKREDT